MNRLLLSLWLLGAVLMGVNTLIILGWPTAKPKVDVGSVSKQTIQPKRALDPQNQQGSPGDRSAAAANDTPALRLEGKAGTVQGVPAGRDSGTPMPAMPPAPQRQAHAVAPEAAAQEKSQQGDAAQVQGESEWVKVSRRGANVRSGPSSSASRLATLQPGQALRVVSRDGGWVEVASPNGAETGWIYGRLLEPTDTPDQQRLAAQEPAQPGGGEQQAQNQGGQSEWVRVLDSAGTVRGSPSDEAGMLFGLPEGRELRVLSRYSGWVLIQDPGSEQVGWIAESSVAAAGGEQEQAATQRPSRAASYGRTATEKDAWLLGEENTAPPEEMVEPQPQPRKWGRRGGRLAGALRRALRAF